CPYFGQELLEFPIGELSSVVHNYGQGDPESGKYVPFEEMKYVESCNLRERFCFDPFSEVIHYYYQVPILSCCCWEGSEDVHSPPSERPRGQ
ncbi:hypothetical protein A2U01_0073056, partial [Trifolium medium]|nr:hypothetical protein [Trifolium medium]